MASKRKVAKRGISAFLIVALALAVFLNFNVKTVVVSGHSMEPTFQSGRRLLVSKAFWLIGPIRDKDIVVVTDSNPDGYIIKRVYKMGGETVDWRYVPRSWPLANGPYKVPPGKLFLIGDNLPVSEDSRAFGPVDMSQVLGKVIIL